MLRQNRQAIAFWYRSKDDAMRGSRSRTIARDSARRSLLALGAAAFCAAWLAALPAPRADTPDAACEASEQAAADQTTILVTVEKVRNSKGLITAVLYGDDPKTFLKQGARLDRIRVEAQEGETVLCLRAPGTGRYSVALYHDENGNKKFDQDFLGVPTEGYGFSRNPGFRFGKPDLDETLFSVDGEPVDLRISLLYLRG
jgi:uncharacterized protein (DUF2141 family)